MDGAARDQAAAVNWRFYEHVLGLRLVHAEADFWVFELPDGRHAEIFGSSYPGREHFATGPVGFAVRDPAAAVDELRRAGAERLRARHQLSGPQHSQ